LEKQKRLRNAEKAKTLEAGEAVSGVILVLLHEIYSESAFPVFSGCIASFKGRILKTTRVILYEVKHQMYCSCFSAEIPGESPYLIRYAVFEEEGRYGIECTQEGAAGGHSVRSARCPAVAENLEEAERLACRLAEGAVRPIHVADVIEDRRS
jgi:hypothetical protein